VCTSHCSTLYNLITTIQSFQHRLASVRAYVDDVNDQCSRLLADNVQLSVEATRTLDSLNQRYKALDTAVVVRIQVGGQVRSQFACFAFCRHWRMHLMTLVRVHSTSSWHRLFIHGSERLVQIEHRIS
jgi:hypothetical protein